MSVILTSMSPTPNSAMDKTYAEIFNVYISSHIFLKEVMPCAICSVLYRRINFMPEYIKIQQIEDTSYAAFRSIIPKQHCVYPLFCSFIHVANFLHKKYLKELTIRIEDGRNATLLEEIVFRFKYNSDEPSQQFIGSTARSQVAEFFKKINMISNEYRHPEELIQIKYGLCFLEDVPKAIISKDFQPIKWPRNTLPLMDIANLQTEHFQLNVGMSKPYQGDGSQESRKSINTEDDSAPSSYNKVKNYRSRKRQSEEFENYDFENFDLLNAELPPLHRTSPAYRSKQIRKLVRMEAVGKELAKFVKTPSTSVASSFSDDMYPILPRKGMF